MNATLLLPAVFSLAGVAIGAAGSLFAANLATKSTRDKVRSDQLSALREERKTFLLDYLRAAQASHDFAARMWDAASSERGTPDNARRFIELDSELWFQSKKLQMVASAALREAATAWSVRLTEANEHPQPGKCSFWNYIEPIQSNFLDAARDEIGIATAIRALEKSGRADQLPGLINPVS